MIDISKLMNLNFDEALMLWELLLKTKESVQDLIKRQEHFVEISDGKVKEFEVKELDELQKVYKLIYGKEEN